MITPLHRFRALAVLLEELEKIPEYDAEANRLYRRLRGAGGETSRSSSRPPGEHRQQGEISGQ